MIKAAVFLTFLWSAIAIFPAIAQAADHTLKPEMVIRFSEGTLACLTRDDLQTILVHGVKGEATKMRGMMVEHGGNCFMLSPKKRVTVIGVEYNDPAQPDFGIVEFIAEGKISTHGAFALSIGAEPVR